MGNDLRDAMTHPMQPIADDGKGVVRFKANAIVRWMLDMGEEARQFDLNSIARNPDFTDEDHRQLAQLLGYSVSGYGDLPYAEGHSSVQAADEAAAQWSRTMGVVRRG